VPLPNEVGSSVKLAGLLHDVMQSQSEIYRESFRLFHAEYHKLEERLKTATDQLALAYRDRDRFSARLLKAEQEEEALNETILHLIDPGYETVTFVDMNAMEARQSG
jgi:hypothetical protein